MVSLAELALEQSDEIRERPVTRALAAPDTHSASRTRNSRGNERRSHPARSELPPATAPTSTSTSSMTAVWIIAGTMIGLALVVLTLGVLQFLDTGPPPGAALASGAESEAVADRADPSSTGQQLAVVRKSSSPDET